jgi:hypothetical protein
MSGPSDPPFFQLEAAERLPRQEVLARGRGGLQLQRNPEGWRKLTRAELVAVVAVPSLILVGLALGESGAPVPVAVISIGLLVLSLVAFAFIGRRGRGPNPGSR